MIPGFPYPWRFRVRRTFALRASIADQTIAVRDYAIVYSVVLWGKSYWAPVIWPEPLRAGEIEYLVGALRERVENERAVFERVAAAVKASDPDAARRAVRPPETPRPGVSGEL